MQGESLGICAALLLIAGAAPGIATSQDQLATAEAVYAAAQYVLARDGIAATVARPEQILVDTEADFHFMPGHDEYIGPGAESGAIRLARVLGARIGRLEDVVDCPDRAPTPKEYASGYWGCRLAEDVRFVVQVSAPTEISDTVAFVWVGVWQQIRDEAGRPRYVSGHGREVELARTEAGDWEPVGTRREGFAHW